LKSHGQLSRRSITRNLRQDGVYVNRRYGHLNPSHSVLRKIIRRKGVHRARPYGVALIALRDLARDIFRTMSIANATWANARRVGASPYEVFPAAWCELVTTTSGRARDGRAEGDKLRRVSTACTFHSATLTWTNPALCRTGPHAVAGEDAMLDPVRGSSW